MCHSGCASLPQLLSHLNNAYRPFCDITYHLQHPRNVFSMLPIVCKKLHPFMVVAYHLQQSHLVYKLQPSNIFPLPIAYCHIFGYYLHVVASNFLLHNLVCNFTLFCKRRITIMKMATTHFINYFPHILIK
jgi:hypothetical protein